MLDELPTRATFPSSRVSSNTLLVLDESRPEQGHLRDVRDRREWAIAGGDDSNRKALSDQVSGSEVSREIHNASVLGVRDVLERLNDWQVLVVDEDDAQVVDAGQVALGE